MAKGRGLVLGAALFVSTRAFAQSGGDVAAAQALFDEGKKLMSAGRYEEACPKLVESQRLDPGGGTLLAIALCHEGQGKVATAWGDFSLALSEARRDRRTDRENAALEHIRALEKRMPRARIVNAGKTEHLEVRRDGVVVGEAQWGTALPVDPGAHRFEAKAPGKKAWEQTVNVPEGQTVDVAVPALADEAPEAPAAVPIAKPPEPAPKPQESAAKPPETAKPQDAPKPEAAPSNSRRPWAFAAGGVAVVSLGVGAAFGLSASGKWHDAKDACPANKCPSSGALQYGTDAGHAADLSTVFFLVGGAAAITSAVLFLLPNDGVTTGGLRIAPMIGEARGVSIGGKL